MFLVALSQSTVNHLPVVAALPCEEKVLLHPRQPGCAKHQYGCLLATEAFFWIYANQLQLALWLAQRKGCGFLFVLNLETGTRSIFTPGSKLPDLIILLCSCY